jgi:PAS domain S-box-containing protein
MPDHIYPSLSDCIIIFDIDEQKYLFISQDIINVLGITAGQLNGNGSLWLDMISVTQRDDIQIAVANLGVNESVELSYLINAPQKVTTQILDRKKLVIDGTTGHKFLVSTISIQGPETTNNTGEDGIFSGLFYKNASPVWILDEETLRFVKVNQAAIAHYGYTEEEFLLMTINDIRQSAEADKLKAYLSENGNIETNAADFKKAGTWKHLNKNGATIYADVNWFRIKYKGRDCIISIVVDVTAKLQNLEDAKRREQFLNSLIDSQTNFLIRIDTNGSYSFVNKQFLKTFGYKAKD